MMSTGGREQGFSLVEVLVSALVLSIGLLGLAGLHVASMKSNHSAFYRFQATALNYDIVDRMRANAKAARDGEYNKPDGVSSIKNCPGGATGTTDIAVWAHALCVLPQSDGTIECETNGDCKITVKWDDSRPEQDLPTPDAGPGESAPQSRRQAAASRTFTVVTRI